MFEVVSCNVHKLFFFNSSFPFVLNRLAKKGACLVGFLLVLKWQLKVGAYATSGYPKQCLLDIFWDTLYVHLFLIPPKGMPNINQVQYFLNIFTNLKNTFVHSGSGGCCQKAPKLRPLLRWTWQHWGPHMILRYVFEYIS